MTACCSSCRCRSAEFEYRWGAAWKALCARLDHEFNAVVEDVVRLTPTIIEVVVKAPAAARALRITAPEQMALGVVDAIIPEPDESGEESTRDIARAIWAQASAAFDELESMNDLSALLEARYLRYRDYGAFGEVVTKQKGIGGAIRSIFGLDRERVTAGGDGDWIDEMERDNAGA